VPSGRLIAISGERAGTLVDVFGSAVLGRSAECAVRIEDPSVSRRHARVTRDDQLNFVLQDLGSRNGTTVRGMPITRCRLGDGDEIGIGPVYLRFELASAEPSAPGQDPAEQQAPGPPGTMDRNDFDERLVQELARAKRCESNLWLLLLGVDSIDQARRDEERETILRHVASTVEGELRADDVLAYYGESQFAILAKDRKRRDPLLLAERIRRLVQETRIVHESEPISVTVSVGVAALADCRHPSADRLLRLADAGFYAARIAGRNCCRRIAD